MRARYFPLVAALVATLLTGQAPTAQALTVHEIPAGWAYTYAGAKTPGASITAETKSAHADKTSSFIVNFNTVPLQYQPAVQAAVDIWSANFSSTVPIHVDATFGRQSSLAVLASSSPVNFFQGFTGAPDSDLYYSSAMANALAGKDLDPANPEITIRINSTIGSNLYLGTDGNCPSGLYDLESIIIHELAHGLGFISNDLIAYGYGSIQQPTPYDAYAQLPDGSRLSDLPSPSVELADALTNKLIWSGKQAIAVNNGINPILYTPNIYSSGSSISHLDENQFPKGDPNAVMTPTLSPGEVFRSPGPLVIAMFKDMFLAPPPGVPVGTPKVPRNQAALVGDKSAIVVFDKPTNYRTAQVSSFEVKVMPGNLTRTVKKSPAIITGLKNGVAYSFSITAKNALGTSDPVTTNAVIPQAAWSSTVLDAKADGKNLATTTFNGKPMIIYSDSKNGDIKSLTYSAGKWSTSVIDGNATTGGKTADDVSGEISVCVGTINKVSTLNIFYADLTKKWLRSASFDGKRWSYSIVDGNGPKIQPYSEKVRVRTDSDVSGSNACAVTPSGVQVFYRDESQGTLLGAVRDGTSWRYELIDGDRNTDNRTTGDVGFHLKAMSVGARAYLLYDSVLSVNTDKQPLRGEVRIAYRDSAYPEDWQYQTLDTSGFGIAVAGFDVALYNSGKSQSATWLASTILPTQADQIRWLDLKNLGTSTTPTSLSTPSYGIPQAPIALDNKGTLFSCQSRLCAENSADQTISLVSGAPVADGTNSAWITLGSVRYAVISSAGKLTLYKAA